MGFFAEKSMGHHGDHPAPCSWLAPSEGVFGKKELLGVDSRLITSSRAQPARRSRSAVRPGWGYVWGYLRVTEVANRCQLWVSSGSLIVLLSTKDHIESCPRLSENPAAERLAGFSVSNEIQSPLSPPKGDVAHATYAHSRNSTPSKRLNCAMSRSGGAPKCRLYSRLNCEGLSYPTRTATDPTSPLCRSSNLRASCSRSCF